VCIAGSARTFASKMRIENWRSRFLSAFDGYNLSVFALLKTEDSDKVAFGMGDRFRAHKPADVDALRSALMQTPALSNVLRKASIVTGSDLPREPWSDEVVSVIGSHSEYVFAPACMNTSWGNTTNGKMVMRWASALQWCHDAIVRYEFAQRVRVDAIAFVRPDLYLTRTYRPCAAGGTDGRPSTTVS